MTRIQLFVCGLLSCVSATSLVAQTTTSTAQPNLQKDGRRSRFPPPSVEIEAQKKRDEYYRLHPERIHPLEKAEKAWGDRNLDEAIRLYEMEKPGYSYYLEAQLALAHLYDWKGEFKKSVKAYQNLKPDTRSASSLWSDSSTQYGYASSMAQAGRWAEAAQIYEYAQNREYDPNSKSTDIVPLVHFRPNYAEVKKLVAWTDYLLGRNPHTSSDKLKYEDYRHLRRAIKMQPTFYEVYANLGMALIGDDRKSPEGRAYLAIAAKHASDPALKEKYSFWAGTPIPGRLTILGRGKDGKDFARQVPLKAEPKRP